MFNPLESIGGWSGTAYDSAMAQIARIHELVEPIGPTIRAGSATTRRLADELAIAKTEAALAQALAYEVARMATQAVVPTATLFGQAIGVAGAANSQADAARQRAMAEWAAQSSGLAGAATAVGDTNTNTATRGLLSDAAARPAGLADITGIEDVHRRASVALGQLIAAAHHLEAPLALADAPVVRVARGRG